MNIFSCLQMIGGIGLFLFGMSLMGSSLEKLAGSGLSKVLEKLTTGKSRIAGNAKGWFLGFGVTGIIQSSAATTMMLIGFVNAGILKLSQAIPVVFGANVGSTVTAQILRLGDLGSGGIILTLLKPSAFAPTLCAIGAFLHLFSKKKQGKDIAGILAGLGILFYGMNFMEEVFLPLRSNVKFQQFFTSFENPFVGILAGLIITAVIQSSSASVGILQALSATGTVTYATAIPIIIGQNIGKCMTILLGAIGARKRAKRVSIAYIIFNIIGAVFFTALIYGIHYTVGLPFLSKLCNRGDIANLHLGFNLITSILLFPFSEQVTKLTGVLISDTQDEGIEKEFACLEERLLRTPAVALSMCRQLITQLAERQRESFVLSSELLENYSDDAFSKLEENEDFIDRCETELSSYLLRLDRARLTDDERHITAEYLNSLSDFERMGDYSLGIAYTAKEMAENKLHFSESGKKEIHCVTAAASQSMELALSAFLNDDGSLAPQIEPLNEVIDKLKEIIRSHHVDRLQSGDCGIAGGVALFDLLNSYERISAHASNIALHVLRRVSAGNTFDGLHGHAGNKEDETYKALYYYYEALYILPVTQLQKKQEKIKKQKAEETSKTIVEKAAEQKPEKPKDKEKSKDKKVDKKPDKKSDKDKDKKNDKKKKSK